MVSGKQNQSFSYIEQMLVELRGISEKEGAPVLAYLIEMAIYEAGDLASGKQLAENSGRSKNENQLRVANS